MAEDPLCGMTVNEKECDLISSFKGVSYFFCSKRCKEDFDEDPAAVLAMMAERERSVEQERSASLELMIDEVAHEVRNPLTSIGGFARKVYKRLPQGDPNKEYMQMIIKEVDRLENVIRQLIKLTAINVSHPVPSDINHIINDTVRSFEEELKNKKIELKLELMDRPPAVSLDGNRIMTAISNLVKNAIEAIEPVETPEKQIKISTRVTDEHMEIEVSDNGKGIPKEKIKYIFDPLFTSKVYAPGLGLTFVKSIIYEHRGTISVQSGPGKGTAFTIRLPL